MSSDPSEFYFSSDIDGVQISGALFKGSERKTMEDRAAVELLITKHGRFVVAALCDGHGGHKTADHVLKTIFDAVFVCIESISNVKAALTKAIQQVDELTKNDKSGTTLTLLVIRTSGKRQVWCANYGDSQAFGLHLYNNQKPSIKEITRNHNLSAHKRGQAELAKLPGYVRQGHYAVECESKAGLAMLGFLGDKSHRAMRDAILPEPHVYEIRHPFDTFVVASDGFHDVMKPSLLHTKLVEFAKVSKVFNLAENMSRWRNSKFAQHDNTSIIVLHLRS